MKNRKNNQKKQRHCQYQYPHCQITAHFQHTTKLGSVTIDKAWICDNCQLAIEKERNLK